MAKIWISAVFGVLVVLLITNVECLGGLGISKVRIVRAQSQQECTKICLESTNCMTSFYNSHIKTCQILERSNPSVGSTSDCCRGAAIDVCRAIAANDGNDPPSDCEALGRKYCSLIPNSNSVWSCELALSSLCEEDITKDTTCINLVKTYCQDACSSAYF